MFDFHGYRIAAPITFYSNERVLDVETYSLGIDRLLMPGQRWELEFQLELQSGQESNYMTEMTFGRSRRGEMIMPQLMSTVDQQTYLDNADIFELESVGSDSIKVLPTGSGVLPYGTFVKFSNHDKVYMTRGQASTLEFGEQANIRIFPNLQVQIDSSDQMIVSDVPFHYYQDLRNVSGIRYIDGVLGASGSIRVKEAI